jgi:hypothetical protein
MMGSAAPSATTSELSTLHALARLMDRVAIAPLPHGSRGMALAML